MLDETKKFNTYPQRALVPSMVTLAAWRLRETWKLLLVTGLGIMIAIMVVCVVPLYSDIAMTAGLRSALSASAQSSSILVQSSSTRINAATVNDVHARLDHLFHVYLDPFLAPGQFFVETQRTPLLQPKKPQTTNDPNNPDGYTAGADLIKLFGTDTGQAGQHLHLRQGRLPHQTSDDHTLEIALTAESANLLHLTLGSEITTQFAFASPPASASSNITPQYLAHILHLRLVGIFDQPSLADPFWHEHSFLSSRVTQTGPGTSYIALISDTTYLGLLTRAFADPLVQQYALTLDQPCLFSWYYLLNAQRITIYDLDTLLTSIHNAQTDAGNLPALNQPPVFSNTNTYQPSDLLQQYKNRIPIAQIPATGILLLVLGLSLFFVIMMTDFLAERQADALALLRSRGADRWQIFGSFVTQGIGLGLLGLLFGVPLSLLAVSLIASHTLAGIDPTALNLFAIEPGAVAERLQGFALATAAISVLAMSVAIGRHNVLSVLDLRRDQGRSTQRAFWQRLGLDIIAIVIALTLYGFSLYITNSNILDAHLRLILLSPITLAGVVCLLVACTLLFLRLFPLLLELVTRLVAGGRSVAPMLALSQMSRAPRRSIRLILLLILATTFAHFALVFTATQTQRVVDVTNYQVGSDFSGTPSLTYHQGDTDSLTDTYRHIPGVLSASLGVKNPAVAQVAGVDVPIGLRAVDADTFAQTAIWSSSDSDQPLADLMKQLRSLRDSANQNNIVPAIVDEGTWNALNLHLNKQFTLKMEQQETEVNPITFVAVGEIHHIPTVNDGDASATSGDNVAAGGILVDLRTYAPIYIHVNYLVGADVALNYVWLKTLDTPDALKNIRKALGDKNSCCVQLQLPYDRRQLVSNVQIDPLYLNLIGILAIGAIAALVLALLGNMIASWLNVHTRLTSFAVLRALGGTPRHITSVLLWEQSITYAVGIGLGTLSGILLSLMVLPYIVYTSALANGSDTSSSAFYIIQSAPPIQIILPFSLVFLLLGLLLMCIIAIAMMVRVVSRPSMSQVLRLNAD